jgi:hypothetical protein
LGEGAKQSGLLERRQSMKLQKSAKNLTLEGVGITDDNVAIPGSLAITGAQIDGASPTLELGKGVSERDDDGTISPASIFVRRTSAKKLVQESILDEQPTMAVSASQVFIFLSLCRFLLLALLTCGICVRV